MYLEIYDSSKLNFVELNFTGDNDNFVRCDKESKYVDSAVFNLFTSAFENANKLYEYYGPTKYNSRKIIPLRNELIRTREILSGFTSKGAMLDYINENFLGHEFLEQLKKDGVDIDTTWKEVLDHLIRINADMVQLTEHCADEEKILWVAGY
jgi:hypothetical protein